MKTRILVQCAFVVVYFLCLQHKKPMCAMAALNSFVKNIIKIKLHQICGYIELSGKVTSHKYDNYLLSLLLSLLTHTHIQSPLNTPLSTLHSPLSTLHSPFTVLYLKSGYNGTRTFLTPDHCPMCLVTQWVMWGKGTSQTLAHVGGLGDGWMGASVVGKSFFFFFNIFFTHTLFY